MACPTCITLECENPADVEVYSLQSGIIFTNPILTFVLSCPPGYSCQGGPFIITIPPGTIKLPVPPTTPSSLRLNCCESTLVETVPAGATAAQVEAIANAMILECAEQQARCNLISDPPPGVNPPLPVNPPSPVTNTKVNVSNTLQIATTECGAGMVGSITRSVAAGTYGEVLWNASALFIAQRQLYWNNIALAQAQFLISTIDPPSITNDATMQGTVDVAFSEQLNGTDGTAPYTFSLVSGAFPSGISMNASGLISGTPTEEEEAFFTIGITDANGDSCSKEFSLTVLALELCPEIVNTTALSVSRQPIVYASSALRLFSCGYSAQRVDRINPETHAVDGTASGAGSWFPGGICFVPAITLSRNTTAGFVAPLVGDPVQVEFDNTRLLEVGSTVTVGVADYVILSIDSTTEITIENLTDTPSTIYPIGTTLVMGFDGGIIMVADDNTLTDQNIYFINVNTMAVTLLISAINVASGVSPVLLYASGVKRIFFDSDGGLKVFDLNTGTVVATLGLDTVCKGLAYKESAGTVFAYLYFDSPAPANTIAAINESTLSLIATTPGPSDIVGLYYHNNAMAYCPTNDCLYIGYGAFRVDPPDPPDGTLFRIAVVNATTLASVTTFTWQETDENGARSGCAYSTSQDLIYASVGDTAVDPYTAIINPADNSVVCTFNVDMANGVDVASTFSFFSQGWFGVFDLIETQQNP